MVIATQNPIEHEGTYPLPESQLDRFLMRACRSATRTATPSSPSCSNHGDDDALDDIRPVVTAADVHAMATAAKGVHVAPALAGYLVDLADATRRHPAIALGMSPRATLGLQRVARARAAAAGRGYVIPDDIKALAEPVLGHRLLVTPDSRLTGQRGRGHRELLASTPVPGGHGITRRGTLAVAPVCGAVLAWRFGLPVTARLARARLGWSPSPPSTAASTCVVEITAVPAPAGRVGDRLRDPADGDHRCRRQPPVITLADHVPGFGHDDVATP